MAKTSAFTPTPVAASARVRPAVLVLGAGVIGLTTARALLARGYRVRILARERSRGTTSDAAGGLYLPFLVGRPGSLTPAATETMVGWAARSLELLFPLAEAGKLARWIDSYELFTTDDLPAWLPGLLPEAVRLPQRALPEPFRMGWRIRTVLVETSAWLDELEREVLERGASIESAVITSLEDVLALQTDVIVNCLGAGASIFDRGVPEDERVQPVRGQVAVLPPIPLEFAASFQVGNDDYYVLPRRDRLILGGTHEFGVSDPTTDPETLRTIATRCRELLGALCEGLGIRVPDLGSDDQIVGRAGIRPFRPAGPRVVCEQIGSVSVIHNYGHGGAGIGFALGCAEAAADLVDQCV
jgi:D-amino-acid oxidase